MYLIPIALAFILQTAVIATINIENLNKYLEYSACSRVAIFLTISAAMLKVMSLFTYPGSGSIDIRSRLGVKRWLQYCDEVVGLYCIAGGLSALATPQPDEYALFYILTILIFSIRKSFLSKTNYTNAVFKLFWKRTPEEKKLIKSVRGNLLTISSCFVNAPFYFIGMAFLSLIIIVYKFQI